MLATSSAKLNGTESFEEAFGLIPDNDPQIRFLSTPEGETTNVFQLLNDNGIWSSPRMAKTTKEGNVITNIGNSKEKLANANMFYECFSKPVYAGGNRDSSWLVGDISDCEIMNEKYDVQGLIISTIFDSTPKYFISFKRLVCENQFGTLGTSNSSMYI